mmetsp:Transcript_35639/g.80515  ORF Transcript_35639/g.80515 Transcript_35639/m.80515 type:complete len:228 (-) Transcript_35639:173-856(-)
MGKRARKKTKTLGEKIEARRAKYDKNKLKNAVASLFAACDEDGNGFVEPHEFVIAQAALAELAGDAFDDEAASLMFDGVQQFDKSGDNKISKKEFEAKMLELCEVLPRNGDEIVNELADKASLISSTARREMALQIRNFFRVLDEDRSGFLDSSEMEFMARLAKDLSGQDVEDEFLEMDKFERKKDGKVELSEFVEHFFAFTKRLKVPKRDIISKLRELQIDAQDAH